MEEKGLESSVAEKIGGYVQQKGGKEILDILKANEAFYANEDGKKGLDDMELLFGYLDALDVTSKVSFDLSLARGLDYYTGLIFEVVTEGSAPPVIDASEAKKSRPPKKSEKVDDDEDHSNDPTIGVGSIAAGGRYDDLVGMFSGKRQVPCVGISFGVDRIFSIIKAKLEKEHAEGGSSLRSSEVDVFIMAFGGGKTFNGLLLERMAVARQLWKEGIKAEFTAKVKPKLPQQFKAAETGGVPLAVILGEDELAAGQVRLKVLGLPEGHPDKDGRLVSKDELVAEVKKLL
jgi:histidyl-tRNA synthetase